MTSVINRTFFCFILFLFSLPSFAAPNTSAIFHTTAAATNSPLQVTFGIYPDAIYDFDMAHNHFRINFYAWWISNDKNYNPIKDVEITNASDYYTKNTVSGNAPNGNYYTATHYYAIINYIWDIRNFPFDRQFLKVNLEDNVGSNTLQFLPDEQQSAIHPESFIRGWKIIHFTLTKSIIHYGSNFGDAISNPDGKYDRLSFIIEIKREGWRTYWSYFSGFFVATLLTFLVFFINTKNLSSRLSLLVAAIICFMGSKYILDQALPASHNFTLADTISLATLIFYCITLVSVILFQTKIFSPALNAKLNNLLCGLASLCYIGVIFLTSFKAISA